MRRAKCTKASGLLRISVFTPLVTPLAKANRGTTPISAFSRNYAAKKKILNTVYIAACLPTISLPFARCIHPNNHFLLHVLLSFFALLDVCD